MSITWESSTTFDDAEEEGVTECLYGAIKMTRQAQGTPWNLR